MTSRSTPCITLSESNGKGGPFFMSLFTGKHLHANKWTEVPMNDEIISKVESMAKSERQPELNNGIFIFELTPGHELSFEEMELEEELMAEDDENLRHNNVEYEVDMNENQVNVISDDETTSDEEMYEAPDDEDIPYALDNNVIENDIEDDEVKFSEL